MLRLARITIVAFILHRPANSVAIPSSQTFSNNPFPFSKTHDASLKTTFLIISYFPIALFAGSLRVQKALVMTINNSAFIAPVTTGCIKDFERLWYVNSLDLFDTFESSTPPVVSSLRHGNNFPLVNRALLEAVKLIGRCKMPDISQGYKQRPVVVNVSFITPLANLNDPSISRSLWVIRILVLCKYIILALSISSLLYAELFIPAIIQFCLLASGIIFDILRQSTTLVYANSEKLRKDMIEAAAGRVTTDVHVISPSWNSSSIDVLVGYSSQLHALTNIPVRASRERVLLWSCRVLAIVLLLQAALLASLISSNSMQVCGSAIWLISYFLMLGLSNLCNRVLPKERTQLGDDWVRIDYAPSFTFSGRRVALAFISTLPISPRKAVSRWDWIGGFIPPNQRRLQWEIELEDSGLFNLEDQNNDNPTSEEAGRLLQEVRRARYNPKFISIMDRFKTTLQL